MNKALCYVAMFGCWFFLWGSVNCVVAEPLIRVSGDIVAPEAVVCRGMVALWPVSGHGIEDPGRFNNVPPWVVELTPDCRFEINVYPGSYYVQGIVRNTPGYDSGPLRAGDLIYMSPDATGEVLQIEVREGQPVDVGLHSSHWKFSGYSAEVESGITGRLVDADGAPLSGLVIQAFGDPQMNGRLLAISAPSDSEGRYQLRLAGRGTLYLLARDEIGLGLPSIGEYFGYYGGKQPKKMKFSPGKLVDDLDIVLRRRIVEESEGKR